MQTIISANEKVLKLIKEIEIQENGKINPEKIMAVLKNRQKAENDEKQPEV